MHFNRGGGAICLAPPFKTKFLMSNFWVTIHFRTPSNYR